MQHPTTYSPHRLSLSQACRHYATLGWRAMLAEVNLTPKPGLVDRHNSGAHRDMAHSDFVRSADAIAPWLARFVEYGADSAALDGGSVLPGLRALGIACEADMFRATAGVNTHKGSIFSLGLLCAAAGRSHQRGHPITPARLCGYAAQFCRGLVARELAPLRPAQASTAGQRLFMTLGITGARGEAEAGYPLVLNLALPHYQRTLAAGRDPELALLDTLVQLMAHNQDTNVAARGGEGGLRWMQQRAAALLATGGIRTPADLQALRRFDAECIDRHLSPGGSADLLILTWFLAHLCYPILQAEH
ncbi:triphosphoribosyl-dephospho-CoA synthase CitG [Edwardsiella piscicida]|uniref:triphosphoribosyl-dephospho-CoA synthase CitG n=1 Tax=Edwardsiella piscicida TaxID=1263550 RepID=UPI00054CC2F3|nr:triphosphoribosyl-dephospho-CoA synthase CitG [Edwardsiella piscicida]ELM3658958.1 triphosphoribosyl-dephospho-CoA synthase CitG [Edwardsiella piscicida]QBB12187.1 triphosphoribosyl-dephospho-CoA synthase CitG [Edwardsiella piscicida]UCQ14908.1 triphosphoribosyl-dephospho-CoA synthase CitG [Edwardsiella piscicida]UCQ38095.1 triphosphoribosyl-dephospho-CoA synthase CitG [Edwardsiella piscicida]UCQ41387.1 triphosphoribosyl-dephospho-CoA synthase CitG [Edwardsiella piscicida]